MSRMSTDEFRMKYGKIKVLGKVIRRHPVTVTVKNDRNRRLMIKFKYGNLDPSEEIRFHDDMKKMIYKVMHTNNVMMDWDDVYQEIWKKIIKCRHTWKESKGTMVSTWISIVSGSVINTLRQSVGRYNSRYCLYDDLQSSSPEGGTQAAQDKCDALAYSSQADSMCDHRLDEEIRGEQIREFMDSLDDGERLVVDTAFSMRDGILDQYDRGVKSATSELKQRLGYDEATYNALVYNIRRKYCEAFDRTFREFDDTRDDGSEDEFLF